MGAQKYTEHETWIHYYSYDDPVYEWIIRYNLDYNDLFDLNSESIQKLYGALSKLSPIIEPYSPMFVNIKKSSDAKRDVDMISGKSIEKNESAPSTVDDIKQYLERIVKSFKDDKSTYINHIKLSGRARIVLDDSLNFQLYPPQIPEPSILPFEINLYNEPASSALPDSFYITLSTFIDIWLPYNKRKDIDNTRLYKLNTPRLRNALKNVEYALDAKIELDDWLWDLTDKGYVRDRYSYTEQEDTLQ
jgi:hypothetical protein